MFLNSSNLKLGRKQKGDRLGDVVLPPWASSPEEFVRINREALESEYVSAHLPDWIDLVFGYKQRGEEAKKAHNLFFYLTYEEGRKDIDSIEDDGKRQSMLSQIEHFGQTPSQLFTNAHVKRCAKDEAISSILTKLEFLQLYKHVRVTSEKTKENPVLYVRLCHEKVITIGRDRVLANHKWRNSTPGACPPLEMLQLSLLSLSLSFLFFS